MPYSQSLSCIFRQRNENIQSIEECNQAKEKSSLFFVGIVTDIIKRTSKNGNPYIKYELSDEGGKIDCFVFTSEKRDKLEEVKQNNGGKLPEEGDILVVKANKKDGNACYAEKIGIQNAKIYMALRDLKDQDLIEEDVS